MKLKEEDLDYAYATVNQDKKPDTDEKYKQTDKTLLIGSPFLLAFGLILKFVFSLIVSEGINYNFFYSIIYILIIFLIICSSAYIVLSLIFLIVEHYNKSFKEKYKTKLYLKIIIIIFAIIIAVIFLNLIMGTGSSSSKLDLPVATRILLKIQMFNLGTESCTDVVVFSKSKTPLSLAEITKDTDFDINKAYFDNPESIRGFDINSSGILRYTRSFSKRARMCILCSESKAKLQAVIYANKESKDAFSAIPEALPSWGAVCVVYPRE